MRSHTILAALAAFCFAPWVWSAEPPKTVPALEKKLIEYGWDVPTPAFIRLHIHEMEQRPFDGLIFRLKGGTNVLEPAEWTESQFAEDFDNLANTPWEKFTDNFVSMLAASKQDWFDDAHWSLIEKNTALVAKAGRIGKCVGICFDPEPYGNNPWDYRITAHKDTKTFAEYQAKVRERGAQFIRAIEREFPNPKILTFYQIALFRQFCVPMDPEERMKKLAEHDYALYPAFLNGILDAAGPGVVLIDGNENAYYYEEAAPYFAAYHLMTQRAKYLIDPALWNSYRTQVQAGQALYIDQYFGLRTEKVLGYYMTPEERPKWFEHNVYWSLFSSDQYVWCYSERMNWWTNTDVPPGAEQAIRAAREKLQAGQELDFDLKPLVQAASERRAAAKE